MDMKSIPIFAAVRAKMEWLAERQKIVAENIANADTPGFRARDLKPIDFSRLLQNQHNSVGLTVTNQKHLQGGNDASRFDFKTKEAEITEVNSARNAVSIEEEMMKLGQTQMEYEVATGIYRKQSGLLKLALGRRQ